MDADKMIGDANGEINSLMAQIAALNAEREKLIEEIGAQQSQRDKYRHERDELKAKLSTLVSAIGPWSTTDLAVKAIERDRAERDRYRAELERLMAVVGEVDFKLIEDVLNHK